MNSSEAVTLHGPYLPPSAKGSIKRALEQGLPCRGKATHPALEPVCFFKTCTPRWYAAILSTDNTLLLYIYGHIVRLQLRVKLVGMPDMEEIRLRYSKITRKPQHNHSALGNDCILDISQGWVTRSCYLTFLSSPVDKAVRRIGMTTATGERSTRANSAHAGRHAILWDNERVTVDYWVGCSLSPVVEVHPDILIYVCHLRRAFLNLLLWYIPPPREPEREAWYDVAASKNPRRQESRQSQSTACESA